MQDGRCIKCEADEVRIVQTLRNPSIETRLISLGALTRLYVCTRCGYVEMYVDDPAELPKIAKSWPKAGYTQRGEN
jgi:predicted nucleic-acid-binding Zn-ribbon protein